MGAIDAAALGSFKKLAHGRGRENNKKSSLLSLSGKGVTVLGKLFTPIVPQFTKQRNWYRPMGREGNCGPGGK